LFSSLESASGTEGFPQWAHTPGRYSWAVLDGPDSAAGRWMLPGQPAAVGAHVIPDGFVYLGRHLRSSSGGVEPALVNPDLPVAAPVSPATDPGSGPELAYHLLPPRTRGVYLDWLAGGRRGDVPAGLSYCSASDWSAGYSSTPATTRRYEGSCARSPPRCAGCGSGTACSGPGRWVAGRPCA